MATLAQRAQEGPEIMYWVFCPDCEKKLGKVSSGAAYALWCRRCKCEVRRKSIADTIALLTEENELLDDLVFKKGECR